MSFLLVLNFTLANFAYFNVHIFTTRDWAYTRGVPGGKTLGFLKKWHALELKYDQRANRGGEGQMWSSTGPTTRA